MGKTQSSKIARKAVKMPLMPEHPETQDFNPEIFNYRGRIVRRLEQSGICLHGWTQTKVAGNPEPDGLQNGQVICLKTNCGMVWDSESELRDATAQAYQQNGLDF